MLQNNSKKVISLPPTLANLLKKRNFNSTDIHDLFSWDLKELPDLTGMSDMSNASTRIIKAIENGEQIGIYGDYDVDGTTSCALFYHFFKLIKCNVKVFQPSRFTEGYGLHLSLLDKIIEEGVDLLITVDCGITDIESADYAYNKGLDLIITDHHSDTKESLPKAVAVINPLRRDAPSNSPLKSLAGVGVAFAVCLKVKNDLDKAGMKCPSIYSLLQFVAVGTIADLVKLTPLNLKLVRHGLKQIKTDSYPGFSIFLSPEEKRSPIIPSEKVSFHIAPFINSRGRLDNPDMALKLLTSQDTEQAKQYYSLLEIHNKERKAIQASIFDDAQKQVLDNLSSEDHLISIVYDSSWHEGVIGIVASKLVETFNVPAIVLTDSEEDGILKASARSAGDLDLFDCLNQNSTLFTKFGGHKAAAGLSLKKENLTLLKHAMNDTLKAIPNIIRTRQVTFDLDIKPNEITPDLIKALELLEPFGQGNEKPIFRIRGIRLDSYDLLKDIHVRWNFSDPKNPRLKLKGISFNYVDRWGNMHPKEIFNNQNTNNDEITILFTLGINRFKGNSYIQLMVSKITTEIF